MKTWKRAPSLMLLLVMALLMLLPLLALLQYHWLGEVTRGEREIMKSNLQMGASQFGQDFDREVKNAYRHFQADLHQFSDHPETAFAQSYRRWQETAAHPRIIGEVYQTTVNDRGEYDLMKFVPASGKFEPSTWPEKLKGFSRIFERQRTRSESAQTVFQGSGNQRHVVRIEKGVDESFFHILIGPVDGEIPGLVIPLISFNPSSPAPLERDVEPPLRQAYCILTFDLEYLKREFIPELVARHFSSEGRRDYYVTVVRRQDPKQVIYQSDADMPPDMINSNDIAENFLRVRFNDFDRMAFTGWVGNTRRKVKPASAGKHLAIRIFGRGPADLREEDTTNIFPESQPLPRLNNEGFWQIAVKHRSGSLEAAVAGARRRNLAISFGILVLLGGSIGLIVLSSRRAQRLALHQMEFVTGVSHELRTPLAVICSAAENLADGVIDNHAQIKRYGSLIRDEGRRLTEMVEQVLEFAGTRSERKRYALRPTDLNTVIENALAACHLQIVDGGFEIEKKTATDLPSISADAAALSRAIQNLLSNAMKFSDQSRWIGLSAEVAKTESGEEVRIEVMDRGLGISPSDLSHIFEPFYRGSEVISAQIHGNGLGLSLVKHIIEAHGGRVSVESRQGQGASFTLHLPLTPTDESSVSPSESDYEQAHFAH